MDKIKEIQGKGILCPIEFKDLPFIPKRMFYITDVPKGEVRGGHAHWNTEQLIICIQGEILVSLCDGKLNKTFLLCKNQFTYVPKLVWDRQIYRTGNDILLCLCSTEYDSFDYINNFDKFKEIKNGVTDLRNVDNG